MPPKSKPSSSHSSRRTSRHTSKSRKPTSSHKSSPSRKSTSSHKTGSIFNLFKDESVPKHEDTSKSRKPASSHESSSSQRTTSSQRSNSRAEREKKSNQSQNSVYDARNLTNYAAIAAVMQSDRQNDSSTTVQNQGTAQNDERYQNYVCSYCDSTIRVKYGEIDMKCPYCGASLSDDIVTIPPQTEPDFYSAPVPSGRNRSNVSSVLVWILVFCGIMGLMVLSLSYADADKSNRGYQQHNSAQTSQTKPIVTEKSTEPIVEEEQIADEIYVTVLNRYVKWSDEYECYYDEVTDCYFFKNYDVNPSIWQYWFEGISSDFGDYGWLEYDFEDNQWYVQVNENDWEVLSGYDTSNMWHMNEDE